MQPLLDHSEEDQSPAERLLEAVLWWERRRLVYTLILLGGVLQSIFMEGQGHLDNGELLLLVGFYLFMANLCYCLGWGSELLLWVYGKIFFRGRQLLFIIGTLLSLALTFALTQMG